MSASPFQYVVPKRQSHCSEGQEPLEAGDRFFSTVVSGEEGPQRIDYCQSCWDKVGKDFVTKSGQVYWVSTVPTKEEPKPVIDRTERAIELLQRYSSDEGNEERQQMAFFLALFLARQKKIFLRKKPTLRVTTVIDFLLIFWVV